MDDMEALARTFGHAHRVIDRIAPHQHGLPTPCAKWTVGELLDHVVDVVARLDAAANGGGTGAPEGDGVARRFQSAAAAGLAGLRRPGEPGRRLDLGPGPMPGDLLARFLVMEILVHAWDLAEATGQDTRLPGDLVQVAAQAAHEVVGPERSGGRFGPVIAVEDGADETDRLLAYLGRRVPARIR